MQEAMVEVFSRANPLLGKKFSMFASALQAGDLLPPEEYATGVHMLKGLSRELANVIRSNPEGVARSNAIRMQEVASQMMRQISSTGLSSDGKSVADKKKFAASTKGVLQEAIITADPEDQKEILGDMTAGELGVMGIVDYQSLQEAEFEIQAENEP